MVWHVNQRSLFVLVLFATSFRCAHANYSLCNKTRYAQYLSEASNFGVKKGLAMGCGMGFLQIVVFGSYTLAFWYVAINVAYIYILFSLSKQPAWLNRMPCRCLTRYGSKLVIDKEMSSGDMLTVSFNNF